ncbi:MAG: transporter substrate-binding domain-containing protein [Acidobacteriota bacterium]
MTLRFLLVVSALAASPEIVSAVTPSDRHDDPAAPLIIALHEREPWASRGPDGEPTGLLIEMWREWSADTGEAVDFLLGDLTETATWVRLGRADLHGGLPALPSTLDGLAFGPPIAREPLALFYRRDHPVTVPDGLDGRRRGLPAWLRAADPWRHVEAPVELFESTDEALSALLDGRLDLVVAPGLGPREPVVDGIDRLASIPLHAPRLFLATRPEHAGQLDERWQELAALGPRLRSIDQVSAVDEAGPLLLPPGPTPTAAELEWLAYHPSVRLGATAWPPLSVFADGRYSGLAIETVRLLFDKIGVLPIFVGESPWNSVVQAAEAGRFDGLGYTVPRPEPSRLVNMQPFVAPAFVLVNRADGPFLRGLDDLDGRTLAVVQDYGILFGLHNDHPGIEILPVPHGEDGLRAVASGRADAFLDLLPVATRMVRRLGESIEPLKLAARLDVTTPMGTAIRRDWPELISLLDRALDETSEAELATIYDHWDQIRFQKRPDRLAIYRAATLLASPLALLCIALVVRNTRQKRVARRERERLREQLWQSRKLEAIGTLSGGVAHDFNNILATILGHSELGRLDLPSSHPSHQALGHIETAVRRGRDLVSHLLAFSQQQRVASRAIDLVPLIDGLRVVLRSNLPSDIELHATATVEQAWVQGDPAELRRILLQLVDNGARAMPAGGRLDITLTSAAETEAISVTTGRLQPIRHWWIRVRDQGIGIPRALHSRLFDPFFTTDDKTRHTGLGLAVVHGLVGAHGGGIRVESTPGEGAAFDVFLPAIKPPADTETGPRPAASQDAGGSAAHRESSVGSAEGVAPHHSADDPGRRLMIVDDEEPLRRALTAYLEHQGFDVEPFADGPTALSWLDSADSGVDLVLTDLTMPTMSGTELADEVARRRPGLPIVVMTGYTGDLVERQLRDGVVREVMTKPMKLPQLAEMLDRLLTGDPSPST